MIRKDREGLDQLEALYNEAITVPAGERHAFIDRVCGSDPALRRDLTSLLAYEKSAETYLNTPAMDNVAEALAKSSPGLVIDQMLGRYHLLSLVGHGGMGEVYCAVDTRLNRLVAIKVLPAHLADHPEWLRRFEHEAQAVAALNHPHICTLYDIGNEGETHYLVFEFLVGELLSDRLRRRDIPLSDAMEHAIEIGEALMHAHEQNVIHLDLKPQNIMLTRTGVKLFDFGISVLIHGGVPETRAGTPGYVAPERCNGGLTDPRTDIFSYGVVMRELFAAHRRAELDSLIERCAANNPSDRWPAIADVLGPLRNFAKDSH